MNLVSFLLDDKFVVVSGGDDNTITAALVNLSSSIRTGDETMTGAVLDTYKIPTAHATQITGRFESINGSRDTRELNL